MKNTIFETEKYYHIYNRGNNWENIFIENQNYTYFLALMKKYLSPIASMYSYCLLPNHFHFVLRIKDEDALPENIKSEKNKLHQPFSNMFNAYAKAINKKYNRRGSLFQEHLKRIEIKNENYLRNLVVYVNTNASHHEIDNYSVYPHSSYLALVSDKPTLLMRNEVINLFDDLENFIFVHKSKNTNIDLIKDLVFE
ncbi:MAG TPA: transposase [Lutibacter sp.]|nr:transposase [Lutibacter sp.]